MNPESNTETTRSFDVNSFTSELYKLLKKYHVGIGVDMDGYIEGMDKLNFIVWDSTSMTPGENKDEYVLAPNRWHIYEKDFEGLCEDCGTELTPGEKALNDTRCHNCFDLQLEKNNESL